MNGKLTFLLKMKTSEIGHKLSEKQYNPISDICQEKIQSNAGNTKKKQKSRFPYFGENGFHAIGESPRIHGFAVRVKQPDINKVKFVFRKCRG